VATGQLELLVHHWPDREDLLDALAASKAEGDAAGEAVFGHIHTSFVTALEREDLLGLSGAVATTLVHTERAAALLQAYGVTRPREIARRLTRVIRDGTEDLTVAICRLRRRDELDASVATLRTCVSEAQRLMREALPDLLADEPSTAELFAWRDIYDELERTIEAISGATRILRAIELKGT
jgi:uncharacterized protein Yka (UPF0111/DUF47 family)